MYFFLFFTENGSKRSQNEKVEAPCNLSSSIYYGGQDVYPPNNQTTGSQNNIVSIFRFFFSLLYHI